MEEALYFKGTYKEAQNKLKTNYKSKLKYSKIYKWLKSETDHNIHLHFLTTSWAC